MGLLPKFLRAVFRHWILELAGGVVIGLIAFIAEAAGLTVPPQFYLLLAGILVFYATFLAWSEKEMEVQALSTETRERPKTPTLGEMLVEDMNRRAAEHSQDEHARALREHARELARNRESEERL